MGVEGKGMDIVLIRWFNINLALSFELKSISNDQTLDKFIAMCNRACAYKPKQTGHVIVTCANYVKINK